MARASLPTQQISTLATAAVEAPLHAVAAEFRQRTGRDVAVQVDTSPNIARRLANGETADVLIALAGTVDEVVAGGKAIADGRVALGKVGIGVAVSRGGRRPDVSTVEALKQALIQADLVLYSHGASGAHIEQMLQHMGVADRVRTSKLATGGAVMERLGEGRGTEIGFTMVSEIRHGESHGGSLVGPVPAALQRYMAYDAVVMSSATDPAAARAFVAAMAAPSARELLAKTGWEF